MSEYHFSYKVVSHLGHEEGRIKLFFARSYDDLGMRIQICVPEEIYQGFDSLRVRYAYNASALPSTLLASLPKEEAARQVKEEAIPISTLSLENGFYLKAEKGSFACTGELAFLDKQGTSKEENVYSFVVNFARKETIHYQIREINRDGQKRDRLEVSVLYPRLFEDLELRLYSKEGTKPLIRADFSDAHEIPASRFNRPMVLPAFQQDMRLEVFIVTPGEEIMEHNYRLGFAHPEEAEPFYFLSDESEYTAEDEIRREDEETKAIAARKFRFPKLRPMPEDLIGQEEAVRFALDYQKYSIPLCPFCGEPIGYHSCSRLDSDWYRICPKDDVKALTSGAVPVNHPLLPYDLDSNRPYASIMVAGAPNCGKTTFLASLFNMSKEGDSYKAHPAILEEINHAFLPKNGRVWECECLAAEMADGSPWDSAGKKVVVDTFEKARSTGIESDLAKGHVVNVKGRYCFDVNASFESNTDLLDELVLSYNPILFSFGSKGHLSFFDVPGEFFASDQPKELHCLKSINSIILLVDGDPGVGVDVDAEIDAILYDALKPDTLDKALARKLREYRAEKEPTTKREIAKEFLPLIGGTPLETKLSGYQDYLTKEQKPGEAKSPIRKLIKTYQNLVQLMENQKLPFPSVIPLAVVFSKLDSRLYSHEGSRAAADDFCFDANTHITHENMVPLYPRNHRYDGSEIQKHIDNSSYEIEEYLRSWNDGPKIVDALHHMFFNMKFFACSALGGADVMQSKSATTQKKVMYRPRPIRMELPIIWLLRQKGFFK